MTAVRWWVRLFARWKARVSGVQGDIGLVFQGITAYSISSGVMGYFGAPWWAILAFLAINAVALLVYAYLHAEGGVWNQVNYDKRWLSNNWLGPNAVIVQMVAARGIVAGLKGERLTDDERAAIEEEIKSTSGEFLDGLDLDEIRDFEVEDS